MTLAASASERRRDDGARRTRRLPCARLRSTSSKCAAERACALPLPRPRPRRDVGEPQPNHLALAGGRPSGDSGPRPWSLLLRVHRALLAVDDVVVDAVLDVGRAVGTPKMRCVLVSFSVNSSGDVAFAVEVALAELGIDGLDDAARRGSRGLPQRRPVGAAVPGPLVAEPERRQDVQLGRFGAAVVNA